MSTRCEHDAGELRALSSRDVAHLHCIRRCTVQRQASRVQRLASRDVEHLPDDVVVVARRDLVRL